ncbi:MAG: Imm44 family immunity protein [Moraxella sp.]|nr:Imm44 family immunity protein [Moraxella sp.]
MKLFIGAEFAGFDHKDLRDSRNTLEKIINSKIEPKEYDLALKSWDIIIILMDNEDRRQRYKEISKYSKTKQDMDFRVQLDYDLFKNGDVLTRQRLIYQALVSSLDFLEEKGLSKSDLDGLRQDVHTVAVENGWV